jgi:glycerophosphoryl diester phosphodiesterase
MSLRCIEKGYHFLLDAWFRAWPQRFPGRGALADCRLVAHRGAHGNGVMENTPGAFEKAIRAGVWGIELDVRWTADGIPVVFPDADTRRLVKRPGLIRQMTVRQMAAAFPAIATLQAVIQRCGGRVHLMVELKDEPWLDPARQNAVLAGLLGPLIPAVDYHLLSLAPRQLARMGFAPPAALLPVAELNLARLSRLSLNRGWAGIAGHYFLTSDAVVARHQAAGQQVGTGYIHSPNSLFRELGRGVTWLFTNQAPAMQALVDRLIRRRPDRYTP